VRILALALVALLAAPSIAQACRCAIDAPFEEASARSPMVIHARVLEHRDALDGRTPTSMTVEILRVLKGDVRSRRMKVWGDPGNLCRPYVSKFPVGTQWLFALRPGGGHPPRPPAPDLPEAAISICGVHWQRVE
jgi:hypothetical protein